MLWKNLNVFGKVCSIVAVLIMISAFTFKKDHLQQVTVSPTPTSTYTLPAGEQAGDDPQGDAVEPSVTPVPDERAPLEAYAGYTPTPLPEVQTYDESASFTFRNIGVGNIVLKFPSVYEMDVALPNQWDIFYPQSYLEIHYDLFENANWGNNRPLVEVYIDGYLAGILTPEKGTNNVARIDLPYLLLEDRPFNFLNTYRVSFEYLMGEGGVFSDDWCDYGGVLTINDDSTFNVTFDQIGARRNLADFPRPLVQDSFLPETLYFILPDDYTENDLAVLATTASAIGRGTGSELNFNVLTASQVKGDMLVDSNVVVIGKPGSNTFLGELYNAELMPTDLSFDGTSIVGVSNDDDGVLQLIAAPQNSRNSYLIVSGNSDQAVIRAAQALSDPPVGMAGSTFVVDSALEFSSPVMEEQDFTKRFSELGFVDRIAYGVGIEQTILTFFVPRDWELQEGAKIVLNYAHSEDISFSHSAMNIYLNEVPIADAAIDEQVGEKQLIIPIDQENILVGTENVIRIETVIEKYLECAPYDPRSAWMMIRDSSVLHLPHKRVEDPENLPPVSHPIYYLVTQPEILFSLPEEPTRDELNSLAYIPFVLGGRLLDNQMGFNFSVNLDPEFDPNTQKDASMILIGRPSRNSLIAEINDSLPQPFVSGEDNLTPKQMSSKYRIQKDVSVGLIQAISAPWNPFEGVTVITGTTDEGLNWAIDAAINESIYWRMAGDIVFVRENVVETFRSDDPIRASLDVVLSDITEEEVTLEVVDPTATVTQETTPVSYVQEETPEQGALTGMYAIYGFVFIGVIVAVIGFIRTVRGGRKR